MCKYCGREKLCHVGTSIPVYIKRFNLGRRGTSSWAVRYSREGRGSQRVGVPWSYEAGTRPIGRAASWQVGRLSSSESEASSIHWQIRASRSRAMIKWIWHRGIPGGSDSKGVACNAGDPGLILGLGRSPGEGNGHPLQCSCLENSMNRGAWQATVHGLTKSWSWLSD